MTDRGIMFQTAMVDAILRGTQTAGERALGIKPPDRVAGKTQTRRGDTNKAGKFTQWHHLWMEWERGEREQRLWVRESFTFGTYRLEQAKRRFSVGQNPIAYRTDMPRMRQYENFKWYPAVHMERWASRLTLIVTDVRRQRLQDITESDARAEGIFLPSHHGVFTHDPLELIRRPKYPFDGRTAVEGFANLFCLINGKQAWDKNDWVIAITFRSILANIDKVAA